MSLDRFQDAPPTLPHHEPAEREDESKICSEPHESREATIARLNVAFGQSFDVNREYTRLELANMAWHARDNCCFDLAYTLSRHADNAKQIV